MILTIRLGVVIEGENEEFAMRLAACEVGMSGEAWMQVFDGEQVEVKAAQQSYGTAGHMGIVHWNQVEWISPQSRIRRIVLRLRGWEARWLECQP